MNELLTHWSINTSQILWLVKTNAVEHCLMCRDSFNRKSMLIPSGCCANTNCLFLVQYKTVLVFSPTWSCFEERPCARCYCWIKATLSCGLKQHPPSSLMHQRQPILWHTRTEIWSFTLLPLGLNPWPLITCPAMDSHQLQELYPVSILL